MALRANTVLLALGANLAGPWGSPKEALQRAAAELARTQSFTLLRASHVYATAPVGPGRQAPYLNAVIALRAYIAPDALLRLVKSIERRAGRRLGTRWGPRRLDIDIRDYGGRLIGRAAAQRRQGSLVLPHPLLHRRAFVLVPLLEVAPHWRHPASGETARALLAAACIGGRPLVRQLDFKALACEKNTDP